MGRVLCILVAALGLAGCATGSAVKTAPEQNAADGFSSYLSAHFAASEHDLPQAA